MIKIIAFDLVGVLVNEKDIELSMEEERLERMFGPNIDESSYLIKAKEIINDDSVIDITKNLINKLYKVKDMLLLEKLKKKYPNIKIIIATNHLSYVREFIKNNFNSKYLDDVIISAEIHKIKPNFDFYEYILDKYNISPNELLFLDDNSKNIDSANNLGIKTIKVEKDTILFAEICKKIDNISY